MGRDDLFFLEGFISLEIFIEFFINSDSNLTQTQIPVLTLKLFPNQTITQTLTLTLILTPKKANKKARMNIYHFRFILFNLKFFR